MDNQYGHGDWKPKYWCQTTQDSAILTFKLWLYVSTTAVWVVPDNQLLMPKKKQFSKFIILIMGINVAKHFTQ